MMTVPEETLTGAPRLSARTYALALSLSSFVRAAFSVTARRPNPRSMLSGWTVTYQRRSFQDSCFTSGKRRGRMESEQSCSPAPTVDVALARATAVAQQTTTWEQHAEALPTCTATPRSNGPTIRTTSVCSTYLQTGGVSDRRSGYRCARRRPPDQAGQFLGAHSVLQPRRGRPTAERVQHVPYRIDDTRHQLMSYAD